MSVDVGILITLTFNAVSAILILAMVALGLTIIFGFMRVINLAHGAYISLGAYTVWLVATEFHLPFWLGFALAPVVVGVIGLLTEVLVVQYLYHRILDTIVATWGVSLVLVEAIKIAFGTRTKNVNSPIQGGLDIGVATLPYYRIVIIVVSIALISAVFILFRNTGFGIRLRAIIQDAEQASILGLNQKRMNQFSFSLGAGLAGLAGAAIAPLTTVEPGMGLPYLVQSFFVVILGGGNSLFGVIPGSVIVGGFTNVGTYLIDPLVAQTLVFVLVVAIIVARPQGLLGVK